VGPNQEDEAIAGFQRRLIKEAVAKKIAGDLLFSPNIGLSMRKWREYFGIKQSDLARLLGVSASVVSDYESGRRRSPGSLVIKRFIISLIEEDEKRGGKVFKTLAKMAGIQPFLNSVVDMREFPIPVGIEPFVELIEGTWLYKPPRKFTINGYTIIDSYAAIKNLSGSSEFILLFGSSTERALIFTKVSEGKSPMVALKVFDLKPNLVVLHGLKPESVHDLAIKLAEIMGIPLVVSEIPDITTLAQKLRKFSPL